MTNEDYCGGTWKGIEYQLDYISEIGANAIWISPITKNAPKAYHGYSQTDLYALNDNFGTAQDLKDLANALHERDMYLMVDVVINHFGSDEPYPNITFSSYYPFNSTSYFHPYCVEQYDNTTSIEDCWLSSYLPDVATERTDIQETYANWIQWLIAEYNIDGLRLDTVEQLGTGALNAFSKPIHQLHFSYYYFWRFLSLLWYTRALYMNNSSRYALQHPPLVYTWSVKHLIFPPSSMHFNPQ